ncbi:PAS domain-containing protein [Poseidonibacter ostreae]|jgi:PAS domain S-box-containing protein|uniref:PAS domain-containing protein n=1 Tax=Poseidonibacter ostreae TaxID=2654171 RepID=A0A6L4WVH2_9BACT|nr:PAS domain-containing protein [Poseidonibacter ostreae]KAB7887362.1 PAS domain-containing protein [Poseidonibacter ostreae]KAB7890088.1 PAS domain-containing protein [Poseidonibacter ostreae]KAB7890794.1 PAS domain-containing protein [Poseidonibacter ostreae]
MNNNDEVILDQNTMIVSETDEKGNIIYANSDFCKIAGYTKEELIGQAHNIVRHPDMPKAAFKDLWETVQAGNIWNGIVKNKTKEGGFYWVNATAYPSKSLDGKLRYISVRVKPTDAEINDAIALYKTLD